jgi:hypothetical protein
MLAMSTTRRTILGLAVALGLGLVLTTQGTAQEGRPGGAGGRGGPEKKFGGGFEKKFDKGFDRKPFESRDERAPKTSLETERLQAQVKALSAKLDSLTAQLRELKSKAAKTSTARGPEKKGPAGWNKGTFGKGASMAKGGWFDKKGPPSRFGSERKGPPSFGRDMRGGWWGREFAREHKRGPSTSARDAHDRGRPSMERGRERGPQARGSERGRPEPSRTSSLESRLDRLIAELESLRREVRSRR